MRMKDRKLKEYRRLVKAEERHAHTIEIEEPKTGKVGVANTVGEDVAVFYGADDGSDDKVVTAEDFSRNFKITAVIIGNRRHRR